MVGWKKKKSEATLLATRGSGGRGGAALPEQRRRRQPRWRRGADERGAEGAVGRPVRGRGASGTGTGKRHAEGKRYGSGQWLGGSQAAGERQVAGRKASGSADGKWRGEREGPTRHGSTDRRTENPSWPENGQRPTSDHRHEKMVREDADRSIFFREAKGARDHTGHPWPMMVLRCSFVQRSNSVFSTSGALRLAGFPSSPIDPRPDR